MADKNFYLEKLKELEFKLNEEISGIKDDIAWMEFNYSKKIYFIKYTEYPRQVVSNVKAIPETNLVDYKTMADKVIIEAGKKLDKKNKLLQAIMDATDIVEKII